MGEAVVLAREDAPGEKRLVAYYTGRKGNEERPGAGQLRAHVVGKLPEYMVPAAYVRMERLPLTANGKLDRKALPAPDGDAFAARGYAAPVGETERVLAAIWEEVLQIQRIGRHDNFFELGGHSLLAVRVMMRIQHTVRVEVTLKDLFAHPVLTDLAHVLENAPRAELQPILRVERGARLPLSFAQQRLWLLAQLEGMSEAYHISLGLRLSGKLNCAALCAALDRIVVRHETLRTTFDFVDGEPVQRIGAVEQSRFELSEDDLLGHPEARRELQSLLQREARQGFDLKAGPLIRGRLIRHGEEEHTLLIRMHHIVSDGWSMGVLIQELSTLYKALAGGQTDPLPAPSLQYADYAVWQRQWVEGEILRQQGDYWKETLSGAPELLEIPADHGRPVT